MKHYGLIGHPVAHSFSPSYFKRKFQSLNIEASYEAIDLKDIADIEALVTSKAWDGFNITIPHKASIVPYLKQISAEAMAIGAVNTVKVTENGWFGYNTDYIGFMRSIQPVLKPEDQNALVLGDGGAAQAVKFALKQMNISYQTVTRNGLLKFSELHPSHVRDVQLIINTTPLGTYPATELYPDIPYEAITKKHLLYDLVYNPEETSFLRKGKAMGARVMNGIEMLSIQADESFNLWNGTAQ